MKEEKFIFVHYNKINSYAINSYAIERAGAFDLDRELKLFTGSVEYKFDLGKGIDVMVIGRLLGDFTE